MRSKDAAPPYWIAARQRSTGNSGALFGPIAEVDEIEGVDRRDSLGLGLSQGALELLRAGAARAHEHHPADGESKSDDHAGWRVGDEAEREARQQRRPGDGRGSSREPQPAAALDRVAELLDATLEPLDLFHWLRLS